VHSNIHESDYLESCYSLVEKQCEWGVCEKWKNKHFEELSFRISKKSGIYISPATLKRVFGKVKTQEGYEPQKATKDALAKFLDYKDWCHFKLSQKEKMQEKPKSTIHIQHHYPVKSRRKQINKRNVRLIVINIIVIACLLLLYYKTRQWQSLSDIQFTGKYLEGKAYHTAHFNYDISGFNKPVEINFGDGTTAYLDPSKSIITNYYQLPGVYRVKLLSSESLLGDTSVYIRTEGWQAYANELKENTRYFPLDDFSLFSDGQMQITPPIIMASGVDTNEIFWTHFCNMKKFNCSGDFFTLETTLKNEHDIVAVRCNHVRIDVFGEHGKIRIYFLKPGCTQWVEITFGEVYLNGKENDLTMFGKDFSDWRNIKIINEDRKVQVLYEDEPVYVAVYQESIGKILGIRYSFTGCGKIQEISLKNDQNNVVYRENFNATLTN
jgi:hypothetical protein